MNALLGMAANGGFALYRREGRQWQCVRRSLDGQRVTCLIAREGVILAGTQEGVVRSDDEGATWHASGNGLTEPYVRWLAYHPDVSDREFAGTEPAGIYISHDGGATWRACPEVSDLRERHGWFLPYSEGAGCVRGFTFHRTRVYAAVEVGGALRSDDGGESWRLAEGSDGNPDFEGPPPSFVYPDVHSIQVHPSSPDLVFASTGGGFYRSANGGKTWTLLYDCYVRAAWLDPSDPLHIILGPAERVGSLGRIEESRDGGETWGAASKGLRVPWPQTMVEHFIQNSGPQGEELFAVLANGTLLAAPLATLQWERIAAEVEGINAVTGIEAAP